MYPLLRYDLSASGSFPSQASVSGHASNVVKLMIVASNPSPAPDNNPVALQGLSIQLPLGTAGTALTAGANGIYPSSYPRKFTAFWSKFSLPWSYLITVFGSLCFDIICTCR